MCSGHCWTVGAQRRFHRRASGTRPTGVQRACWCSVAVTGAGKTTMASYAVGAASGFSVSAFAAVESEINLQYGAVHQLLIPFLPLIGYLPAPQRQALRVAFGMEVGPQPDRFLVGLAGLTLLARAAADEPVLCAVDDARWIDPESSLVLGFVARRLYADRVAMILTVGDEHEPPCVRTASHRSTSAGFRTTQPADLLHSTAGVPLEAAVVDRVVDRHRPQPAGDRGGRQPFHRRRTGRLGLSARTRPDRRENSSSDTSDGCTNCRTACRSSCCSPRPTSPVTAAGFGRLPPPRASTLTPPSAKRKLAELIEASGNVAAVPASADPLGGLPRGQRRRPAARAPLALRGQRPRPGC